MNHARNTDAIVHLAAQKRQSARARVRAVVETLAQHGLSRSLRAVAQQAHVSRTFLYDPKNADLAAQIRHLQTLYPEQVLPSPPSDTVPSSKSTAAKDAQIARLQERVRALEREVRDLRQENEQLYGQLATRS